jgi:hypothetical protein
LKWSAFCFFGCEALSTSGCGQRCPILATVELAARDQVSVEEFVSVLLANRSASHDLLDSCARLFNRVEFDRALDQIPDVAPEEGDRI